MSDFLNSVALVSGGGTGIGLAIARELKQMNIRVIIIGRREKILNDVSKKDGFDYRVCDITDMTQLNKLRQYVLEEYRTLDILINNAGVFRIGPLGSTSEHDFDLTMNTNVKGLYFLTQQFLPVMLEKNSGYIINISSHAGKRGLPNSSLYCASKFSVMGINDSLHAELHDTKIKVSAICPGYVATPMTSRVDIDQDTMIQPDDITAAVRYLLGLSEHAWTKEIIIERLQ